MPAANMSSITASPPRQATSEATDKATRQGTRKATLYRMVMDEHVCPYGLKAKDLLGREGFEVEDHWLTTQEATDAFKAEHGVKTTPQVFIGGTRIGGYDDLRRYFGKAVADPKATSLPPVIALFAMTALMALAASYAVYGTPFTRTRAASGSSPSAWRCWRC